MSSVEFSPSSEQLQLTVATLISSALHIVSILSVVQLNNVRADKRMRWACRIGQFYSIDNWINRTKKTSKTLDKFPKNFFSICWNLKIFSVCLCIQMRVRSTRNSLFTLLFIEFRKRFYDVQDDGHHRWLDCLYRCRFQLNAHAHSAHQQWKRIIEAIRSNGK